MIQSPFRKFVLAVLIFWTLPCIRMHADPNLKDRNTAFSLGDKVNQPSIMRRNSLIEQFEQLYQAGKYSEAIPIAEEALELAETTVGPNDPDTARALNDLGAVYHEVGELAKAEPLFQRALKIRQQSLGNDHPLIAQTLNNLAALYVDMLDYAKAESLFQQALTIRDPDMAKTLNNLAELYRRMGHYAKAKTLFEQALSITKKALGSNHPDVATFLGNLAELYREMGEYSKAELLLQRAVKIEDKALGPDHLGDAASLYLLAELYREMGDYAKAESLYQRRLTNKKKTLGIDHPGTASVMYDLAVFYHEIDNYGKAEPLLQQALQIIEKALGSDHPTTAPYIHRLAAVYQSMGNYTQAELLCQRALTIEEKARGADHPDVATMLATLATIYREMGNYAKAGALYQRALKIKEKKFGPDDPKTATVLDDLARLYVEMGDYTKAELLLLRALKIAEQTVGPNHPNTATALKHLARLYLDAADYTKARPLLERQVKIQDKAFGSDHPKTASALSNLAMTYLEIGDYTQAELLFQRVMIIDEKVFGRDNPNFSSVLNKLATVCREMGDCVKAESFAQRALKIDEKALGTDHLIIAGDLNDLAGLYSEMGDDSKAEPLLERALKITEQTLGPDHRDTATALTNLAALKTDLGKREEATPLIARVRRAEEKQLANILSFTSEEQRLAFQRIVAPYTLLPTLGCAAELAEAILRHKGVVLDSLLEDRLIAEASNDPKQRERIDRAYGIKQRLMQLILQVPKGLAAEAHNKRAAEVEGLSAEVNEIEADLARQVAGLGKVRRALSVTVAQIQSTLPPQTVLVELVKYPHYLRRKQTEWRYGASLIAAKGKPKWVPLGSVKEIEEKVQLYRQFARDETDEATFRTILTTLGQEVWEPIEKELATGTTAIIISPDAELNFLSFATLLRADNRFVSEKYSISYVASGRDLLRKAQTASVTAPIRVFANPDFAASESKAPPQAQKPMKVALRSIEMRDLQSISLQDLPCAELESLGLKSRAEKLGWPAQASLGSKATEAELRRTNSPRILHLATHGFFLPETDLNAPGNPAGVDKVANGRLVNPMHRSGLAMAGAQTTFQAWGRGDVPPTENDGIVTAEEVGGLKLEGTWLVVLSACDTGSGEAKAGEGVMGLRRGFIQAGGQNLLMTLWPISDEITVNIMLDFYDAAFKTGNASQALADTQRDWLVKLRNDRGLLAAVQLAGPFIMSSQGRP